ncbi:MAG: shikimate dehydrogenase [Hylemonella sp.]|nr:shikimate dehydrogenase [Hylemonella sp.]
MATDTPYTLAGVMGWPVAHSRSPAIHGHWIRHYGLNGHYVLLPVQPERIADAVRGLPALGFAGCNITIPHKVAAMALVDRIDPLAARIGAINTVVVDKDGRLSGYNTDAYGFIQSLLDAQPDWRADAGPVTVLGAGGAARAILVALAERGAREIRLCNRSPDKAQALAAEFGGPIRAYPWEQREDALEGAALLVNTTSLGMKGQEPLEISLERLPRHALVCDIIYVPLETPLLAAARERGNATVNGLGMLLNQARPAFQHWFGVLPEVTPELRRMVEDTIG